VHRATIAGGLVSLVLQALPLIVWQTGPWLTFAGWAAGLVA
jgi:hypothetical protein